MLDGRPLAHGLVRVKSKFRARERLHLRDPSVCGALGLRLKAVLTFEKAISTDGNAAVALFGALQIAAGAVDRKIAVNFGSGDDRPLRNVEVREGES